MDDPITEFRKTLLAARHEAQNSFDKHLISLSGGGLAVSIAFIHNVIGGKTIQDADCLLWAWILWLSSITFILFSFYTSRIAYDKAIKQIDADTIHNEIPGGKWNRFTAFLNFLAILSFIAGTSLIIIFASNNLRG